MPPDRPLAQGSGICRVGDVSVILPHARRELDVEVFDRELAGDQAGEEEVAGLGEYRRTVDQVFDLFCYRSSDILKFLDKRIGMAMNSKAKKLVFTNGIENRSIANYVLAGKNGLQQIVKVRILRSCLGTFSLFDSQLIY